MHEEDILSQGLVPMPGSCGVSRHTLTMLTAGDANDSVVLSLPQPTMSLGLQFSKLLTSARTRLYFIALMSKGGPLGQETRR